MLRTFFTELRAAKIPVSITEYLSLLQAMDIDLAQANVENFYFLARVCLVKDVDVKEGAPYAFSIETEQIKDCK